MKHILSIATDGTITTIWHDELEPLLREGKAEIQRASNVEPGTDCMWYAHMVNGPILGPFRLRSEALAAETAYLEKLLIGGTTVCQPQRLHL